MKRRLVVLALVAEVTLGVSADAAAQNLLDRRVTMSFTQTPPAQMLLALAKMTGLEANIDRTLTEPVSLTLENVTVRTLLDAACDSIGCRWRIDANTLVVEALPVDPTRSKSLFFPTKGPAMPAGSRFVNESVGSILDAIGRVIGEGARYDVPELSPSQLVTVDLSNQDALRAVAMVVKAAGHTPGFPYTVTIRRAGEKPTTLKTQVAKDPDLNDFQ